MVFFLGRGGFGITYLCVDNAKSKNTAVKEFFPKGARREGLNVLPPEGIEPEQYYEKVKRFLVEAEILEKVNDHRVVRLLDSFEENNTAYYVMEYVEGPTLQQFIRDRGPLGTKEALDLIREIALGLKAIHEYGFVHGDLKPSNILLKSGMFVRIADFGASGIKDSFFRLGEHNVVSLNYSAPELFTSQAVPNVQTDIYSLGGVLYFLVTGESPVPATQRAKGKELMIPDVGRKIKKLILKAMALSPEKRFYSVDSFLKALDSFFF
ncbi:MULTISPECIES: serine/threonine-protein kinase [Kosmotoga]|uniref:serine/threonine protein kinase n=1 Tax=Kosmotoga TaxID=651456 RepID=UPI002100DF41|nr:MULTISPECIES: serine/threonine-protein kinase [Kosmotoga]